MASPFILIFSSELNRTLNLLFFARGQACSPQEVAEVQIANPRGHSLSRNFLTDNCCHVLEQPGTTFIYRR